MHTIVPYLVKLVGLDFPQVIWHVGQARPDPPSLLTGEAYTWPWLCQLLLPFSPFALNYTGALV